MASKFSCIVDATPIRSRSKQPANLGVEFGGNSHVFLRSNEMEAASPRMKDRKTSSASTGKEAARPRDWKCVLRNSELDAPHENESATSFENVSLCAHIMTDSGCSLSSHRLRDEFRDAPWKSRDLMTTAQASWSRSIRVTERTD